MADQICFTVHVYELAHESHQSRLAHISQGLQGAAQDVRAAGGAKTEGIVLGSGAVPIASWQYLPCDRAR